MSMDFLKDFDKEIQKMEGIGTSSAPPRYWYTTGNYVLNKIISGNPMFGIPQGRVTNIAGPSGAGKSYISANIVQAAQAADAFCLVLDSENALDDEFMGKIGVDVNNNYRYFGVTTIPEVTKIVSTFLKGYELQEGTGENAQQVVILIDSLDMLMTETERDHFESGVTKGDQGQKNKQLKAMLRTFVQAIKKLNVAIVCTSQVYKNQDIMNGEGVWIVSDAVKYACSQIILVQKRKLKDEAKDAKMGDFAGVRMICEGYKTRFTKPFQRVEIEVPYETGMDPLSGLKDVAVKAGILIKRGGYLQLDGDETTWRESEMGQYLPQILSKLQALEELSLSSDEEIEIDTETKADTKARRKAKVVGSSE